MELPPRQTCGYPDLSVRPFLLREPEGHADRAALQTQSNKAFQDGPSLQNTLRTLIHTSTFDFVASPRLLFLALDGYAAVPTLCGMPVKSSSYPFAIAQQKFCEEDEEDTSRVAEMSFILSQYSRLSNSVISGDECPKRNPCSQFVLRRAYNVHHVAFIIN